MSKTIDALLDLRVRLTSCQAQHPAIAEIRDLFIERLDEVIRIAHEEVAEKKAGDTLDNAKRNR